MKDSTNIDQLTGLPYLNSIYSEIAEQMKIRKEIGYIYFDIVNFPDLQERFGTDKCMNLLKSLGTTINQQRGRLYREDDLIAIGSHAHDRFILFLFSPPRKKICFSNNDLKLISSRILQKLTNILREDENSCQLNEQISFQSGYSIIKPDPNMEVDKIIYETHKEATLRAQMEKAMVSFISNISHELRTPLTCIKGYAETLLEGAMADETLCTKFLKIINDEAQRLERLINDLLDLSMLDAKQIQMRFKETDITKVMEDTVSVFHPYAKKTQVKLAVDIMSEIPTINADEDRIRQVIINLLDNAIKYSPINGTVSIKMAVDKKDVKISITDQGIGIPDSEKNRIFDRFYRVDEGSRAKQSSRGLGLAISKYIIEAHSGAIWVEDALVRGSSFFFTLPIEDLWGKDDDD